MERQRTNYVEMLLLAALVGLALVVGWRLLVPPSPKPPVAPGTPMPPLEVAGWLNVPDGETVDPAGKVVVVDLWATWCTPCRAEIPRLAKVVERYRPLGVEFIGLSSETEADLPQIEEFLADVPELTWPTAYGAIEFWNALEVQGIPMIVVFGTDGRARWSAIGGGQGAALEQALDEALANAEGG